MNPSCTALLTELGQYLQSTGYQFTTVTPLTHQRVLRNRSEARARGLRDVFGWNMPFAADLLPGRWCQRLADAGLVVEEAPGQWKSTVRWSTLEGNLYVHSDFPTSQEDAVFFGPDTYRFARLLQAELGTQPLPAQSRILDMGCGAGPGGLVAARAAGARVHETVLADINPRALQLAQANAALAGIGPCTFTQSDLFQRIDGDFDCIVSNPPYLLDAGQRSYRHGGGLYGEGLSQRILAQSLARLRPQGRLVLYTGSAVVNGADLFCVWAADIVLSAGCSFARHELDPDVFGEELDHAAYSGVERIAAVGLVVQKPAG